MYCGKEDVRADGAVVDTMDGPVAVIRNLQAVWPVVNKQKRRVVVVDRFYTSVALFTRLHRMGYHAIGTSRIDRKGFPNFLKMRSKEPPADMPRGDTSIAVHKKVLKSLWIYIIVSNYFFFYRCQRFLPLAGLIANWFTFCLLA